MINETQSQTVDTSKNMPFGSRLKSAREALGLERKDAAAQLRLNEKIIVMLEKDKYPSDLPITFIRGYIRAYGKLLQIPENEIRKAIEPIMPTVTEQETPPPIVKPISLPSVSSGDYFMQIFTYLIIFTMIGLVGMWWYSHSTQSQQTIENQANSVTSAPTNNATPTPTATVTTNAADTPAAVVPSVDSAPNAKITPPVASHEDSKASPAAPVTTENTEAKDKSANIAQSNIGTNATNSATMNQNAGPAKQKADSTDDEDDDASDVNANTNNEIDTQANSENAD